MDIIDIKTNRILWPIQKLVDIIYTYFFNVTIIFVPHKYKDRYKNWGNSTLVKNTLGLLIINGLGSCLLLLTNIKIANVLGAATFGLYSYYLSIGDAGATFVRYGRDKTMVRDLIQKEDKFNSIISNTLFLGLINLTLVMLLTIIFSKQLEITICLASLLVIFDSCLISIDMQPVYESIKLMSWHSIYNFVQKLLFLALFWSLLLLDKISLSVIAIFLFISWMVVLLLQYSEIFKSFSINPLKCVSFTAIADMYKKNFLIATSCMLGILFAPFIQYLLNKHIDSTAVGLYAACFQIFFIGKFLVHQIARVGNPMMAEAGRLDCSIAKRKLLVNKYAVIMTVAVLPFVIPMVFFPSFVTKICYSEEYFMIKQYIPYFGIFLFAQAVGCVYEQFLISMRKDNVYFTIYTFGAVLTLIISPLLIMRYGLYGGVLSFVLPNILTRFLYFAVSKYYIKRY